MSSVLWFNGTLIPGEKIILRVLTKKRMSILSSLTDSQIWLVICLAGMVGYVVGSAVQFYIDVKKYGKKDE
jgi:hypothetical protein